MSRFHSHSAHKDAPPLATDSRSSTSGRFRRPWHVWLQAFAAMATVIASTLVPAAFIANAASSTLYLDQATDPHGGIWLAGTTNGLTNGPMDTSTVAPASGTLTWQALSNTAPAGWSFGHLW